MTEPAHELGAPRPVARAQHHLGARSRHGRPRAAHRARRRRRPRGTCRRASRPARRVPRARRHRSTPSSGTTCTASSSPPGAAPCARLGGSGLVLVGPPVTPTRTRSRVSHGPSMSWRLRYSCSDLVDTVGHPQQRQLAQRAEVALPEVVRRARRRPSRAGRRCRAPCGAAAPAASCRRARCWSARAHDSSGIVSRCAHAGDALDHVVHRLEVLDVHRRDHVDAGLEQLLDVLPALRVARARARSCARARRPARRRARGR